MVVGPTEHQTGSRLVRWRIARGRPRLRGFIVSVLLWSLFLARFAPLFDQPPFIQAIVYAGVAPAGWHNASIPGPRHVNFHYAFSSTVPGLILAQGETTEWGFGTNSTTRGQYWRTRDGGVQWQALAVGPCVNTFLSLCNLAAPVGGADDFFTLVENETDEVWVTHNAGTSWRRLTIHSKYYVDYRAFFDRLYHAVVRDGRLYMMYAPDGNYSDPGHSVFSVFSFGNDDGATWTATARAPSTLELAGWGVVSVVADYQAPGAWYRALLRTPNDATATPMLEHSSDDGRTWTTVGPFGIASARPDVSLATNPATPERLCAYTGQVVVLASTNGGRTFQAATLGGVAPVTIPGYAPIPVKMGVHGECYLALEEVDTPKSLADAHDVSLIWSAAPGATVLTPLPGLSEYGFDGTSKTPVAYMSGGSGFPARIVTSTWGYQHPWRGWAPVFGDGNYNQDALLLWTPVP